MIEYNGLGKQFDEMGKTFQGINSLPHIVLGENKQPKKSYIKCPYCQGLISFNNPNERRINNLLNEADKIDSSIKRLNIVNWALILGFLLVIGYAVYRLIWG